MALFWLCYRKSGQVSVAIIEAPSLACGGRSSVQYISKLRAVESLVAYGIQYVEICHLVIRGSPDIVESDWPQSPRLPYHGAVALAAC
jgi:hypothetical protein